MKVQLAWPDNVLRHAREVLIRLCIIACVASVGHHTFFSDANGYFKRAHEIGFNYMPYRDFLWEYPPFAAVPLVLIPMTGRNAGTWLLSFITLMVVIEYTSLLLLRRARPEHKEDITKLWRLSVLPLAAIGWFRLDFIPMLCATIAIIAMMTGRRYIGPVVVGFATKLWPLVFGVGMVLQRRRRDAFITAFACIALVGAWYAYSPDGFRTFLEFRRGSGFQVESIPGSLLLLAGKHTQFLFGALTVSDKGFGWAQVVLQVVFLGAPFVALAAAWRREINLVALLGGLVCVMLLSTRLLSPQFLVWVAPFVAWLWPETRRPGKIFIAGAWITVFVIQLYQQFIEGNAILNLMIVGRDGLLIWLAVELFRYAFRTSDARQREPLSS